MKNTTLASRNEVNRNSEGGTPKNEEKKIPGKLAQPAFLNKQPSEPVVKKPLPPPKQQVKQEVVVESKPVVIESQPKEPVKEVVIESKPKEPEVQQPKEELSFKKSQTMNAPIPNKLKMPDFLTQQKQPLPPPR